MSTDLVQLQSLVIEEISGVDEAANLAVGWMVAKSANGTTYRIREPHSLSDLLQNIRTVAAAEGADRATLQAALVHAEATAIKASFGAGVGDRLPPALVSPGAARKERGAALVESGGAVAQLKRHLFHLD